MGQQYSQNLQKMTTKHSKMMMMKCVDYTMMSNQIEVKTKIGFGHNVFRLWSW